MWLKSHSSRFFLALLSVVALFCSAIGYASNTPEKKQTICLNMIVKNESKVIERCLASAKPLIDYWVISDTGSTDGTQDIIRNFLKDIPGELREDVWSDFATNRNIALKAAKGKADFVLFIDADETFTYPEGFCLPNLEKDYYFISVQNERGGILLSEYKRILLIDNRLDWKWEGVLHETINSSKAKSCDLLKDLVNISRTEEGFRFQDPQKFLHDAQVLEKALKTEPGNSRYVFYIAQSYLNAGERSKALEYFQKRAAMEPGRRDSSEIFLSLYYTGVLQSALKMDSDTIISSYTKAHSYCPWRAEPLYYLGSYFLDRDNYLLAELLFRKALTLQLPSEPCIVETWIYEWGIHLKLAECLFKMQNYQESKSVMQKLLTVSHLPLETRSFVKEQLQKIE